MIVSARFSSASRIFGKATFESTTIVNTKARTVQIISPSSGVTRNAPPSSSPEAVSAASVSTPVMSLTNSTSA